MVTVKANMVAHGLARQAFISKTSCIWFDETPDFILSVVARDVTVLYNQYKLALWCKKKEFFLGFLGERFSFLMFSFPLASTKLDLKMGKGFYCG